MLQIPLWKRVVIWALVALGLWFAMPNAFYSRVELHNDAIAEAANFGDTPERQAARALWPDWLPATIVNLGLDLRGGAQLLAEVQVQDVYADRLDAMWPEIRDALREVRPTTGLNVSFAVVPISAFSSSAEPIPGTWIKMRSAPCR